MKKHSLLFLSLWLALVRSAVAGPVGFSDIRYPLPEGFNADQGTIEFRVRPDGDFSESTDHFYRFFTFRISLGAQAGGEAGSVSLFWSRYTNNLTVAGRIGENHIDNLPTDSSPPEFRWESGKWYSVAVTWNQKEVMLYCDGQLIKSTAINELLPFDASQGFLYLGYADSEITAGELCVSNRALSEFEIDDRARNGFKQSNSVILYDDMSKGEAGDRSVDKPEFSEFTEGPLPGTSAIVLHK